MKYFLYSLIAGLAFVPAKVFGQDSGQIVPCSGADCDLEQLGILFNRVVNTLIQIGVGFATIAFVYAGFLYITSAGDTGKHDQAKRIFWTVAKGLLIILIAALVVKFIFATIFIETSGYDIFF
jgi:hypothetical protein